MGFLIILLFVISITTILYGVKAANDEDKRKVKRIEERKDK